jgi:hypothetical protein
MQDVINTCDQMAETGELVTSTVKEDCFKAIDAFNLVVTDVLRNNSAIIENILYGK